MRQFLRVLLTSVPMGACLAAPVLAEQQPVPPSVTATTVPGHKPPAPALSAEEAEFARKAVADGAREAATAPAVKRTKPPVNGSGSGRDVRRPDPAWGKDPALVELSGWRQAPYLDHRDRLRSVLSLSDHDPAALRDLLRFQLAWNMAPEVRATLQGRAAAEEDQILAAIAAVLTAPQDRQTDRLLTNQSLRAADGPLWAAVLLQRRGQGRDAILYLPTALRALPSLPPEMRRDLGLDLLSIAADAGLDGMARAIAKTIEPDAGDPAAKARLHEAVGRLHAAAGRATLALAQWDQAAALEGADAARARLEAMAMRVERGERTESERIDTLDRAIRDWAGTTIEAESLWQLALLARQRNDPLTALEKLRLLALRFPDRSPADRAASADLAVQIFDGLATSTDSPIALSDRITAFQRHRDLLPSEPAGWAVRRRFARMLSDAGAQRIAMEELQVLVGQLPAAERLAVIHDLVTLQLTAGDAAAALATLEGVEEATPPEIQRGRELRARALLMAGDSAGAMAVMADGKGADALAVRAASLWQQGKWNEAARNYKALAAERPLPPDEAARYALAAMLAGDPAAGAVIEGQGGALDGRRWGNDLLLLARPVPTADAGERDLRGLLDDAQALGRLVQPARSN